MHEKQNKTWNSCNYYTKWKFFLIFLYTLYFTFSSHAAASMHLFQTRKDCTKKRVAIEFSPICSWKNEKKTNTQCTQHSIDSFRRSRINKQTVAKKIKILRTKVEQEKRVSHECSSIEKCSCLSAFEISLFSILIKDTIESTEYSTNCVCECVDVVQYIRTSFYLLLIKTDIDRQFIPINIHFISYFRPQQNGSSNLSDHHNGLLHFARLIDFRQSATT